MFVGHAGHPEVIGTFGQVPEGRMTLIETAADAETVAPEDPEQCSPSSPRPRFRSTTPPRSSPYCGAASLRSGAAERGHLLRHLQPPGGGQGDRAALRRPAGDRRAEQLQLAAAGRGRRARGRAARLVGRGGDIDFAWLEGVRTLGITAGASAPEVLVREVVDCARRAVRRRPRSRSRASRRIWCSSSPRASRRRERRAVTEVEIFTDGACKGNPGPGGWGVVSARARARRSCPAASRRPPTTGWS